MSLLRILLLEDDPSDAELIRANLEADQIVCDLNVVKTRVEFLTGLKTQEIDLVLADYKFPSFDGLSALKLSLSIRPDLPFIFVSGTFGEESAIEALKIGATDYVLKTRLSKLVPAVRRALREKEERPTSAAGASTPARFDPRCHFCLGHEQGDQVLESRRRGTLWLDGRAGGRQAWCRIFEDGLPGAVRAHQRGTAKRRPLGRRACAYQE